MIKKEKRENKIKERKLRELEGREKERAEEEKERKAIEAAKALNGPMKMSELMAREKEEDIEMGLMEEGREKGKNEKTPGGVGDQGERDKEPITKGD